MSKLKHLLIASVPVFIIIIAEALIAFLSLMAGLNGYWPTFLSHIGRITGAIILLVHFKSFSTGSPFKWGTNKLVAFIFFSFALSASYLILRVELHNPPFEKIIFYKYNWINTISAILIASWTEEFIFRGWVLGFLKEKGFNIIFSILYSSFLFGLWHFNIMNINSWRHSADTFFLGIIFGTLFIWSNKNIWFCIFAHLTANSCVTIFDLLEIQRSDSITILIPSILVLVITSTVLFKSKGNQWILKTTNRNKAQL